MLNPNGVKRKKGQNADAAVRYACTGKERKKAHAAGKITEEMCGKFCLSATAGIISEIGLYASADR